MKNFILTILFLCITLFVNACPECEKQQPKILKGIAHGAGPQSQWDYVIVWGMVAIVLITLFYTLKFIIKPNENKRNHIKNTILNFQ
jgi:hypothetical protein